MGIGLMEHVDLVIVTPGELALMIEGPRTSPAVAARARSVLAAIAPGENQIRGSLANRDYLVRTYTIRVRGAETHGRELPIGTDEFLDALHRTEDSELLALSVDSSHGGSAHIFASTDRRSLIGCIVGKTRVP